MSEENRSIPEISCRICGERSSGTHFGVDACRACAAFFRRTIHLSLRYTCRSGNGTCALRKKDNRPVKFNGRSCRHCRYLKCLETGMLPENLRPKRSERKSNDKQQCDEGCSLPSSSIPPSPVRSPCPLLQRLNANYSATKAARLTTELAIIQGPSDRAPDPVPVFMPNVLILNRIARAVLAHHADFCNRTFQVYDAFGPAEKWLVLREFFCLLLHTEEMLLTAERQLDPHRYRAMSLTTVLDFDKIDEFLCSPSLMQSDIKSIVEQDRYDRHRAKIVRKVEEMRLTEMEVAALVGLCLWSTTHRLWPDQIEDTGVAQRRRILDELHHYYREEARIDNYATRLGSLLELFNEIEVHSQKSREDLELIMLFHVLPMEPDVYNIFRIC